MGKARTISRWIVAVIVVLHGLIHLLGAVKAFGWADVSQLTQPIGPALGGGWLLAAVLVVTAGILLALCTRWWWAVGAVAVVVSQAVILTSWSDARAGTAANVLLLAAVVHGYAAQGPRSFRAQYRRRVAAALAASGQAPVGKDVVTEADLAGLPPVVAMYLRRCGAVGQPRVRNFRARIHGRIRAGASSPWMTFTGEQVNTFGREPGRFFFMDATLAGLPIDVLHVFDGPRATMRVRACSLVPMVNAAGPEMDRSETVTVFNDLCLLAPGALIGAPVTWEPIDAEHVRARFTRGAQTVTADLVFDADHDLVDFVSDDRSRGVVPQRWSTPVRDYRGTGRRRLWTGAEARWHAPAPEGEFAYLEIVVDDISYNAGGAPAKSPATAQTKFPAASGSARQG